MLKKARFPHLLTIAAFSLVSLTALASPKNQAEAIRDQLSITVEDSEIKAAPLTDEIRGGPLSIKTTATVHVEPAETVNVRNEEWLLPPTLSNNWGGDGHLKRIRSTLPIHHSLIPSSVVVCLEDGTTLTRDKDYIMNDVWASLARLDGGRITTSTKVQVTYEYSLQRIDGIDITKDGFIIRVPGKATLVCPEPPPVTANSIRLANVYRPFHSTEVEPWHIFKCGEPFHEPSHDEQVQRSKAVSKTLTKLKAGQPVTIVMWGDSVTEGCDASRPELAYTNLFISRLQKRFPASKIKMINAGIGGTNTDGRLPHLANEVLAHKPDLVTIEFVNDMELPLEHVRQNWNKALDQITSAGAEAIVITPHFTMPSFMKKTIARGTENRPGVQLLKDIAHEKGAGLADTSARWAHLDSEGIPYMTLLFNGINHPNDTGHEMFVKDLMSFFPAD